MSQDMNARVGSFYRTDLPDVWTPLLASLGSACFRGMAMCLLEPAGKRRSVNFDISNLERKRNMRRFLILTTFIGLFAAFGLADTYTGKLIDVSCLDKPNPTVASCQPSTTTTTFALVDNSQKVYKLDEKGNAKAAAALKNRADRSADPSATSKADVVVASITGTMNDGIVTVEKIEVQ
jgi:hypothetical protein